MSGESPTGRVGVQHGPGTGVLDGGPFTSRQLARIDEALTLSSQESGLTFSVYVGELAGKDTRKTAEGLYRQLEADVSNLVLLAVSPGQRALHIVTGPASQQRLPNRACALAAVSMRSSFVNGDIAGGIVTGLRMLADSAGRLG